MKSHIISPNGWTHGAYFANLRCKWVFKSPPHTGCRWLSLPVKPMRKETKVERELARLRRAHATVAQLVAIDPVYLPIFERLEAEIAIEEAALINDPIAKARAIAAARRAISRL
ncbi:hypothetical protein NKI48_23795 [Mesorhizobium sp. M0644]|uniref:hypothetical protein n=1 Tax=Mesorhizobium sp. M0644 TaxID=2956979 RepID=UPI003335F2CB